MLKEILKVAVVLLGAAILSRAVDVDADEDWDNSSSEGEVPTPYVHPLAEDDVTSDHYYDFLEPERPYDDANYMDAEVWGDEDEWENSWNFDNADKEY